MAIAPVPADLPDLRTLPAAGTPGDFRYFDFTAFSPRVPGVMLAIVGVSVTGDTFTGGYHADFGAVTMAMMLGTSSY